MEEKLGKTRKERLGKTKRDEKGENDDNKDDQGEQLLIPIL